MSTIDNSSSAAGGGPLPGGIEPSYSDLARLDEIWAKVRSVFRSDDDKSHAQRAALLAFAIRVLSAGIAFASQVLLARWMGSAEYGIFVFVWVWVLILGALAPLGLNVAMIRFIPEYLERSRLARLRGVVWSGQAMSFAVGSLVTIIGLALLFIFPDGVDGPYKLPIFLALFCVPTFALTEVQDCIGRARSRMMLALVPPYILRPTLILVAMLVANWAGLEMCAATAAGAALFATWATGLVQFIAVRRDLRTLVDAGPQLYDLPLWLKTSFPILLITGFEVFLQNTDVLVISRYMTSSDVGLYFAALKTMSLITFVHFAVGAAVANRFSAYHARGDRELLRGFVRDAAVWTFWPTLIGALGILSLGYPLLWLFGPEFTQAWPVMFILAAGFILRAAMGPAEFLLNMLGEQKLCAAVMFMAAAVNIALNFALVPYFGLAGAAGSTALSLSASAVAFYCVARARLDIDVSIFQTFRR